MSSEGLFTNKLFTYYEEQLAMKSATNINKLELSCEYDNQSKGTDTLHEQEKDKEIYAEYHIEL